CARRRCYVMTMATTKRAMFGNFAPGAAGLGALIVFFVVVEILIQAGLISRFLFTLGECLIAGVMITVFGIASGVLMHRFKLLQQACETWVAAMASAPVVLCYPLFMVIFGRNAWTIIMI